MEIHMTNIKELVINFHMTEACNYRCGYCYAKWQDNTSATELHHSSESIQDLLLMLAEYFFSNNQIRQELGYQSVRINFAGGEPVMLGARFVSALLFAKSIGFNTSLITNGHFLSPTMLRRIAPHLDMLGLSFDTADYLIAQSIGRTDRKGEWFSPQKALTVTALYRQLNPQGKLKVNTVVNAFNFRENLNAAIALLQPDKWKLLRALPVYSDQLTISQEKYDSYVQKHKEHSNVIAIEDNYDMWQSYLMINPEGNFYQNSSSCQGLTLSPSILDIGVSKALNHVNFNVKAFASRYPSSFPQVIKENLITLGEQ